MNECTAASPRKTHVRRRSVVSVLLATATFGRWHPASARVPAPLLLAHVYKPGIDLHQYAVSEKYDGVRGYWDGRQLWTRGSEPIHPPAWFTAGWPAQAMDGELWAGRGRFAHAVSAVRQQKPDDAAWHEMKFMVFDGPTLAGTFADRSTALAGLVRKVGQSWVIAVQQTPVATQRELKAMMETILSGGGEGVMLHRLDSAYRAGRSSDLLKYKPNEDADALVLAHVAGRGKYEGMLGALLVQTPEGVKFKLGTGFDDNTRRNPPPIGAWISYRYRGENDSGIPRFASYLRMRADL